MPGWNIAEVWEAVADTLPDAPAQVQGERRFTWAELDRRADGVAHALLEVGVQRQDKVAQYLYNCPEYIESVFGIVKAGLVPVNTNYRYADDELVYLWSNADAVAVVFHGTFASTIERIRERVPSVRLWLWVDDGSGPCPPWATEYESAAASVPSERPVVAPWGRSGDDLYLLYTGGTTGMPKGVMWRQDDLFMVLGGGGNPFAGLPPVADMAELRSRLTEPGMAMLPACPLMHGTGALSSFGILNGGGRVVLMASRSLDTVELFDLVEREKVNVVVIVGDAFAKPMLAALDANPGRWDLSSLILMVSSGVMWSEPVKQGLLRHHPGMMLVDAFSSSEALGMGQSVSSARGAVQTARFTLGQNARVITEDGRDVVAGSGEIGMVAVKGYTPAGYYKDPEKSARTFRVIDGERYSVPGDFATVEADGTLRLLGRGSVCINTGGEKVYPEEVEEVLKEHPAVRDAVAVGVPDDRFGEAVTAVVVADKSARLDEKQILAAIENRLAKFKLPKRVIFVDDLPRNTMGKVQKNVLRERCQALFVK